MCQRKHRPAHCTPDYLFTAGHSGSCSLGHRSQLPPCPLCHLHPPLRATVTFCCCPCVTLRIQEVALEPDSWAYLSDFRGTRVDAGFLGVAHRLPRRGSEEEGLGPLLPWAPYTYLGFPVVFPTWTQPRPGGGSSARDTYTPTLLVRLLFELLSPAKKSLFILFMCGCKWALHLSSPCLLSEDKLDLFFLQALILDN